MANNKKPAQQEVKVEKKKVGLRTEKISDVVKSLKKNIGVPMSCMRSYYKRLKKAAREAIRETNRHSGKAVS